MRSNLTTNILTVNVNTFWLLCPISHFLSIISLIEITIKKCKTYFSILLINKKLLIWEVL